MCGIYDKLANRFRSLTAQKTTCPPGQLIKASSEHPHPRQTTTKPVKLSVLPFQNKGRYCISNHLEVL